MGKVAVKLRKFGSKSPSNPWHIVVSSLFALSLILCVLHNVTAAEIRVEILEAWRTENWRHIGEWLDEVKAEFERKNPGVTVEYEHSKGIDGLILAAASGTRSPDVVLTRIAWAQNAYKGGLLSPLNKYWERSPLKQLTFFPATLMFNQADGVIYGFPWALEAYTIVYNKDLFEQSGLDPDPDAIGSWQELVAAGRSLHRQDGAGKVQVAGFHTGLNFPLLASWLYANGGRFYNEDFTEVAFDSPEGYETIEFLADLINNVRIGGISGIGGFHAGQVGMMTHQLPAGAILSEAPFNAGQTDFPPGPSGHKRSSATWSNMFSISSRAEYPDLAWEWIETMLSPESQDWLTLGYQFPQGPYLEAYRSETAARVLRERPYLENTSRILENAGPWPFVGYDDVTKDGVTLGLLSDIATGKANPKATLAEIARLFNLAIKQ